MFTRIAEKSLCLILLTGLSVWASANDPFAEMESALDQQGSMESSNPEFRKEYDDFKAKETEEFDRYKEKLMKEFSEFKKIYEAENAKYVKQLSKVWHKPELSSKKVWVEYSSDLKEKRAVDFEKQQIAISFAELNESSDKQIKASVKQVLKDMLVKNKEQAFKDDVVSQAIENKSKKVLTTLETAKVKPEPILLPLVSDKPELTDAELDAIVEEMLKHQETTVSKGPAGKKITSVSVPIVKEKVAKAEVPKPVKRAESGSENKAAKNTTTSKVRVMPGLDSKRLPKAAKLIHEPVRKYAEKADIDPSLVFAVIETESAFNPMAKSPIPAYGLMQIVPSSAGMDVTAKLFGKSRILSPSYLYASEKNIEAGTTYLNILYYRYLRKIENKESRLYCAIAAYNTGAGNVAKAFTGELKLRNAIKEINKLSPQEVYDHLVEHLPYDETRKYLQKVHKRIPKYKNAVGA